MGCATTRTLERVAAALGELSQAPIQFESVCDVPQGGVLLALPALLATGLLKHTRDFFLLPKGFYGIETIFLLLALMALARIKSLEGLRYAAPGEWGKLMGLDRIPEVKTLREKLSILCNESGRSERWGTKLASDWMKSDPESSGVFYVDGHVRPYHGELTQLPRRYVTRQRLCLRGTTDYWINALGGQPFFVVTQEVDPGLLSVLREKIVPWLKQNVPDQPTELELQNDPHRLTIVFDREGYSPGFFAEMKSMRIAVLTYRKSPGDDWAVHEFQNHEVRLVSGEVTTMKLAERGVYLGEKLWMREIRKLTESGHQTAILSTDFHSDLTKLAASMFARWCQENFFKYMREHFNLDRLLEYGTEPVPATTRVVNPRWRELDGNIRSQRVKLQRQLALFGESSLSNAWESSEVESFAKKKGEMQENIAHLQQELEERKRERKETAHHVTMEQLPQENLFTRLATEKKHFVDTIKMIAYRAETAMAHVLKEKLARADDVRVLLRQLYETEADLKPDLESKTLTVQLHHLATRAHNEAIRHLCEELTATETIFPGTYLRLIYKLGSFQNPTAQEV